MSITQRILAVIWLGVAPLTLAQVPEVLFTPEVARAARLDQSTQGRVLIIQNDSSCVAGELGEPCQVSSFNPLWDDSLLFRVYRDEGPGTVEHIFSENVAAYYSAMWFFGQNHVYFVNMESVADVDPVVLADRANTASTGEVAVDQDYVYWTENTLSAGKLYRAPKYGGGSAELLYTNPVGQLEQLKAVPSGGVLLVTSLAGGDFFRDRLIRIDDIAGSIVVTEGRALTESYTFDDSYVYQVTAINNSPRTLVRAPLSNIEDDVSGIVLSNQNDGTSIEYIVVDDADLYYYRNRTGGANSAIYRLDKTLWATGNPAPITGDIGVIYDLNETSGNNAALIWRQAGGILKLRKSLAQTFSVDLSITAVEAVQSVQTPRNTVFLVAGKATTARVYPVVNAATNVETINASVELIAEDAQTGVELQPALPRQTITLTPGEVFDRKNLDQTVNFELPPQWANGDSRVILTARIQALGIVDTNPGNNQFVENGPLNSNLRFWPRAAVCVKLLPIASTTGLTYRTRSVITGAQTPGFSDIVDRFNTVYAAERMIYYTQYAPIRKPQFLGFPQPFNLFNNADGDHLIASLWEHDLFDNPPDWCGGNGARTHYSAMVDPGIDTGVSGGYGSFSLGYSWSLMQSPGGGVTMAHEFGHNYNTINGDDDDWQHVNCQLPAGSGFNDVYPYRDDSIGVDRDTGVIDPTAGWGFDRINQNIIRPDERADYMSYCNAWVSDYRWREVFFALNSPSSTPGASASFERSVSDVVAVFGLVDESESAAEILSANLALSEANMRFPLDTVTKSGGSRDASQSYTLQLLSGDGVVLQEQTVFPVRGADGQPGAGFYFSAMVPWSVDAQSITLVQNQSSDLAHIDVSDNEPIVSLSSPSAGAVITDTLAMSWTGSDVDGDPLQYTVQYSADGGVTWSNIASGLTDTTLLLEDAGDLAGSSNGALRVLANDGVRLGMATVSGLIVDNRLPRASITGFEKNRVFEVDEVVTFTSSALDAETGPVQEGLLSWSLQGPTDLAGTGAQESLVALHPGEHSLEVSAEDPLTGQNSAVVSRHFTVAPKLLPTGVAPTMDGTCADPAYLVDQHPIPLLFDDGTLGSVHMVRAAGYVYLCYSGMKWTGDPSDTGVYAMFDRNGDGGPSLMDDNFLVGAYANEIVAIQEGTGSQGLEVFTGILARTTLTDDVLNVELEIDESWLNFQGQGWDRTIRVTVGQLDNIAQEINFLARWPLNSDGEVPDTFGVLALSKQFQSIDFPALPTLTSGGEVLTLQATATSGLPVQFTSITPEICTVFAGNQLQPQTLGACRITASQPGSAAYFAAQNVVRSIYVTTSPCELDSDCDNDGASNETDNCLLTSNAEQVDADQDGIGNACDADYNNDCIVNFLDIVYFTNNSFLTDDPLADHNNDGVVNFVDYVFLVGQFLKLPGPSLVALQCD